MLIILSLLDLGSDSQLLPGASSNALFELEGNSHNFSLELGTFIWKVRGFLILVMHPLLTASSTGYSYSKEMQSVIAL